MAETMTLYEKLTISYKTAISKQAGNDAEHVMAVGIGHKQRQSLDRIGLVFKISDSAVTTAIY